MEKPEWLGRQSSHPHGLLGHLVAAVMAIDTASANRRVVDALASEPGDRIPEARLGEIRRVLVPGGPLLLAFHTSEEPAITRSLPESIYTIRTEQEVAQALALSGFHDIRIRIDPRSRLRHAIAKA